MKIDHQIDEEMILREEVSDEALEAAALVAIGELPTLPHTYCFACPSDPLRSYSAATRARTAKPPVLIHEPTALPFPHTM